MRKLIVSEEVLSKVQRAAGLEQYCSICSQKQDNQQRKGKANISLVDTLVCGDMDVVARAKCVCLLPLLEAQLAKTRISQPRAPKIR